MKANIAELLKGTTLRSQIYKTISGTKMASFSHLFKNNRKVKYLDSASEGADTHADNKPKLKHNHSLKKLNSSNHDNSLSNNKPSKEASKEKAKA